MATATLFNKAGNTQNYTAQITARIDGVETGYKIIVTGAGAKGLVVKDLDTNETIFNGTTGRQMNTQDLKAFVLDIVSK